MDQNTQHIEELFRNSFKQQTMTPSPKVLRRLRFRLWQADFFSLKPTKLNIVYSTLLIGGIASAILITKKFVFTSLPEESQSISLKNQNISKEAEVNKNIVYTERVVHIADNGKDVKKEMLAALFEIGSNEGCAPFTVRFENRSVNASSYRWDFGDGNLSDLQSPSYTYRTPGLYNATLSITNKNGEKDLFSKEIKVKKGPEAGIAIDIGNSVIGERKIAFKNLSKGSATYRWDFGDNNQSNEKDAFHTYNDFGLYNVKLITQAANGCSDTAILTNKFLDKNYELLFPFNFRPNTSGPGNNGIYDIAGSEAYIFYPKNFGADFYELKIMALNGIEVFSTSNIKQGWNGYVKGRLAPAGTYNYKATGVYPNGKPFTYSGSFKVIIEDYYQN